MSCCVPEYNFCIVRGNSFTLGVGFIDDPYGIATDPTLWSGELGIRTAQRDSLVNSLTLTSLVAPDLTPRPPNVPNIAWIMTFEATPTQTQALPARNLVAYCEIINSSAAFRKRLWQGRVTMED
jgi:hypothetical protein